MGLSFATRKLSGKSLPPSIDVIKSLRRFGERMEMEIFYDYLRDKWGIGEAARVVKSSRALGISDHRTTAEWFRRLQVANKALKDDNQLTQFFTSQGLF